MALHKGLCSESLVLVITMFLTWSRGPEMKCHGGEAGFEIEKTRPSLKGETGPWLP